MFALNHNNAINESSAAYNTESSVRTTYEEMLVDDFIAIPDCKKQRNTESRAARANRKHLKNPSPTHKEVSASRLANGELVKIDGHTRAYLWAMGLLEKPDIVHVTIYHVDSHDAANAIYDAIDNPAAAKGRKDDRDGAFRLNGITPQSTLVQTMAVHTIARMITGAYQPNLDEWVAIWADIIVFLDEMGWSKKKVNVGIVAAILVTLVWDRRSAVDFWTRFMEGRGNKQGDAMDAVESFTRYVEKKKSKREVSGAIHPPEIALQALTEFKNFRKNPDSMIKRVRTRIGARTDDELSNQREFRKFIREVIPAKYH